MFIDTYISEEKIKKKVLEISENINRGLRWKRVGDYWCLKWGVLYLYLILFA